MMKDFFQKILSYLKDAIEVSKKPTNNVSKTTEHSTKESKPVAINPVVAPAPIVNYPASHDFSDYLFRAMRDVPDMCNLKSCDSAHNIQAWRINNNSYVAQLYKKDSSHEIRKSDFLHQIQPWFNHSLKTVRYNAEEDVKELQRHYQSTLAKLQQNYSLNCAHSPQNQNEYTIQYQLQVQHELYKYRSQLQKLLHLLCTVTVVDMNDYGYYVIAQFVCNTTPRIPL